MNATNDRRRHINQVKNSKNHSPKPGSPSPKQKRFLDPDPLSPKERAEARNLMAVCYVRGKNQLLRLRGKKEAAQLYRENWDGCRELWKLEYHRKKVKFTVIK